MSRGDATILEGPDDGERTLNAAPVGARGAWRDDPLIGRELGGCEVVSFLGQGGMATVYLARQLGLDREVAVKVLSPKLTRDEGQVEQFMREAKTLAKLEHPNIVTVYAVGQEEQTRFLVIQLIRGGSLQGLLKKRGKLPPSEATELIKQVARGLGEAHGKGIIHRDIKPGNILVAPGPTMKVTDFGLALIAEGAGAALSEGRIVGTPHYMSPEQVDAREVDARTDIYALGATFYHLLTGAPPFQAASAVELLLKHVNEPVVPPHERAPEVPEALSRVVVRMLAKEPGARYGTMDEVLAALDRPEVEGRSEPAPALDPTLRARETLLVSRDALAPLSEEIHPLEVRTPPGVRRAAVALIAFTGVLFGVGIGPLRTVLGRLGPAAAEASPVEAAAELALGALEREAPALAADEALARFEAFVAEHRGTPAAERAEQLASRAREELDAGRRAALEAALAAARRAREAGELGPALDRLAAIPAELRALPEAAAIDALGAELQQALARAGVAWVPAGEAVLGEGARQRTTFLQGYYIGLREVTRREYAAFAAAQGLPTPGSWADVGTWTEEQAALPATDLDYREARAFALERGGRLPTAAEWERAARGPEARPWPWGDAEEPGFCNWGVDASTPLRAPGSFPDDLSPAGCLDMAGNAAELTEGPGSTAERPQVWVRGGSHRTRVLANARPAFWVDVAPDVRHPAVGFRLAFTTLPGASGEAR